MERNVAAIRAMGDVFAAAYAANVSKNISHADSLQLARDAAETFMRTKIAWIGAN